MKWKKKFNKKLVDTKSRKCHDYRVAMVTQKQRYITLTFFERNMPTNENKL